MTAEIRRTRVLAGAVVLAGVLAGAQREQDDITKKRALLLREKRPALAFRLPKERTSSSKKKGIQSQKWVFRPVDEVKQREQEFWQKELEKWQKYLTDADDPEKKLRLKPEDRKLVERNVALCRSFRHDVGLFFDSVRLAIEDPGDPTTAVFIQTTEINREFTIENAVQRQKSRPPIWRLGRVAKERKILTDGVDRRFKDWKGWVLHVEYSAAQPKEGEAPEKYHDMIYTYRKALKKGGIFLVEIYCRWRQSDARKEDFAKTVEYLLRGLRLLDR